MKLYHGSDVEIENIDLSYSQINKDFGKGFYLSDDINQASVISNQSSVISNQSSVIIHQ